MTTLWVLWLLQLAGCTLLGIGIWFLVDTNSVSLLNVAISDDALLRAATIIIIVVGSVMIVIGFLGCCGSCFENATCLFVVSIYSSVPLFFHSSLPPFLCITHSYNILPIASPQSVNLCVSSVSVSLALCKSVHPSVTLSINSVGRWVSTSVSHSIR